DTYWWGIVERISPEAPVPVVALQRKELRVGGAANVALNAVSLGANTTILSVIGEDAEGVELVQLLEGNGIRTDFLLRTTKRVTTNKTRIMSRNQQMMRLDAEITDDLDEETEALFLQTVEHYLLEQQPQVLILEDYNKGILTPAVIKSVIQLCRQQGVITSVDPKKKNFLSYEGVDIFKPNLKEIMEGLNMPTDKLDQAVLRNMHEGLRDKLSHAISLITLSEKGVYYHDSNEDYWIPTHIRNIADVSGAGDTVIAVASLVYAVSRDMRLAAEMANIAGGLVCEEVGTAPIKRERFMEECAILLKNLA
ncbi:MAG TPA: bifunctional ADP-heptose synthase, partial [Sediminibacterium sp.]|nr:bifunctional ADP-heptose synthase [Sediminibacterium sp.]